MFKVHDIQQYNYSFDARVGGAGQLQLWAEQGKVCQVNFVEDNAAVPAPTFPPDLSSATVFFKRSTLPELVDMLRNEKPIRLTINDQGAGFVFIHTGPEPVGEGEK